ncbi:MAG: thioredoxin-disulfide reductase, partial [Deltaproteobacteria bacterium]
MHDLVIIGGGPAGLTAGLYGARARLDVLLLERLAPGGQVLTTDWIENYPGFPDGLSGFELIDRMKSQAERFGLKIQGEEVLKLELSEKRKAVFTGKGPLEAKAVILACGAAWKKLGIEGEDHLLGRGVSFCATCDAPFYRDQEVAVIGGGDTAVEESLFLTRFVSKVHLVHRRDQLRATKLLQERAMAEEKIKFIWDTVPVKVMGKDGVEGIGLKNVKTGSESRLDVKGIFVFIGTVPNTEMVRGQIQLDENGFVITDSEMRTSVPGVFGAGDIRSKLFRQVATAVGDGAAASFAAEKYI